MKVIYEKHPVSPERKAELRSQGFKIIDAQFAPASLLKQDGPTVAEFVGAGYRASDYPPEGYESRSTDEEIASAVAKAEKSDKKVQAQKSEPKEPDQA